MNQELIAFILETLFLKKIKNRAYVTNLDEYPDVSTHWNDLFCNRSEISYFDSFGVEHVPEKIEN